MSNKTALKLNKVDLIRFLSIIQLENDLKTSKCVIKLHNDVMEVCNKTSNKVVVMLGKMKVSYSDTLSFCIDDIEMFLKILNNIKDEEVELKILTSKIAISGEKTSLSASVPMTKEEFVTTNLSLEKFDSYKKNIGTNTVKINLETIKEFIKMTKMIGSDVINLEGENNTIKFYTENKQNELNYNFEVKDAVEKFNLKFSKLFINLINVISNDIELVIKDSNSPVLINLKEGNLDFEFLIGTIAK